jgi:hypothetical protein
MLGELRRLPPETRESVFQELNESEKIELFFEANKRHPPYTQLNDSFGTQGVEFLIKLRSEIDLQGGVPEVLSFLGMVLRLKVRGELSSADTEALRIEGICELAERSQYCSELEARVLAQ